MTSKPDYSSPAFRTHRHELSHLPKKLLLAGMSDHCVIHRQSSLSGAFLPFGEEIPKAVKFGGLQWRATQELLVWAFRKAWCMFGRCVAVTAIWIPGIKSTKPIHLQWVFLFMQMQVAIPHISQIPGNGNVLPYLFRWKITMRGALVMVVSTTASCFVPHKEQWIWLFKVSLSCWKKHLRQSCQRKKQLETNHLIKQISTPEDPKAR